MSSRGCSASASVPVAGPLNVPTMLTLTHKKNVGNSATSSMGETMIPNKSSTGD
jgi:hypothetical protein